MEILQDTAVWITLLVSLCLFALWQRWRRAHPRCPCCRKHIRRAFAHCPWCGLPQVHVSRAPLVRPHRRVARRQRDTLLAQEATQLPHKRRRTVILPATSQRLATQGYRYGTVLVPEPTAPVKICAQCQTVQHEDDIRCWFCESSVLIWKGK
jgi:hypothetical protein